MKVNMKEYLILKRKLHDGMTNQELYRFSNNFGASVIKGPYSYGGPEGLYELAVIRYVDGWEGDFTLRYDTPIGKDVVGYLTRKEVNKYLKQILELPWEEDK